MGQHLPADGEEDGVNEEDEKRGDGRRRAAHSLGAEAHAETGQVAVGEGEEDHEDDVPGVVLEDHAQVVARLHVAQHEERHEDDPQAHQDREPDAVLARLQRRAQTAAARFTCRQKNGCLWPDRRYQAAFWITGRRNDFNQNQPELFTDCPAWK